MSVKIIDSHCHLNHKLFEGELDKIIQNAHDRGVETMITICTELESFESLLDICRAYNHIYCTAGIHPCSAIDCTHVYDEIIKLGQNPFVVGIGETGLDYFHKDIAINIQKECFLMQIEASNKLKLPLIIHSRDAEFDTMEMLKRSEIPGVLHCFTGSYEMAKKALDKGFMISLSGILTYPSAHELMSTVRKLPINSLLVETDAPYLVPHQERRLHKRNEPAFITETVEKLALCLEKSFEEMCEITTENSKRLFKL